MNRIIAALLAAAALGAAALPGALPAAAHDLKAGNLQIIHPHSRPNIPNRPAVVYVVISNDGPVADRLTGVSAPDFEKAEIHESKMAGGVMSMSPVAGIDVPAGDSAVLEPGGYHIMLFGAKTLFKPGDMFPATFTFEKQGPVNITVMVMKMDGSAPDHSGMDHSKMNMQPSN